MVPSERYHVAVGRGVNASLQQNDFRMFRQANKAPQPSHPSQGDLLEMIDTTREGQLARERNEAALEADQLLQSDMKEDSPMEEAAVKE